MRAWAAPIINGIRQDQIEVELDTEGLTVLPHTLPWPEVSYRYEYAPGEEMPVVRMTRSSVTEEEIGPEGSSLLERLRRFFVGTK
jgi:hypothetical protein